VVAPTAAARDVVAECYGVTGRVVHNGRSAHWVQSVQKEPFVLGVGRLWDLAKNVAALGRIAERVAWPVFVAGDDTAPDGTRRHLAGPLRALGSLPFDELAGWLGRAAVFASPARYEPFGLGALEAALSGCALVLGDIPSFRELWGDRGWGDAAVFVDPLDDERLARELDRLTRDPHRCVELGALARARAERYTPDAMATGYRDVYASISTCQATT
jgi:glycosyltransferase involved in cell wall biosynthesis